MMVIDVYKQPLMMTEVINNWGWRMLIDDWAY
jgi:hypothetical protein